jgi:hypothetical protein
MRLGLNLNLNLNLSGVTTLICGMTEVGAVRTMAELVL